MAQLKRMNWEKWLYPWEGELQTDQAYREGKRKNHMSKEHSAGIVSGCAVLATGTPDLNVHVQVGRLIDPAGNAVKVESIADLDLSSYASGGGTAYIYAEFAEVLNEAYIVTEIGGTQYKYYLEQPTIGHQGTAPTGNKVELARAVVTNGATQLTNADDPLNPGNNEIDHRNRLVSLPQSYDAIPGYKVLDPNNGTVLEQLALLGITNGDRFYLSPGDGSDYDWTAGSLSTFQYNDITFVGTQQQPINMSIQCDITGSRIRFNGMNFQSESVNGAFMVSQQDVTFESVLFDKGAPATITRHVLLSGDRAIFRNCIFDTAGYACLQWDNGGGARDTLIEKCLFNIDNDADAQANYGLYPSSDSSGTVVRDCVFNIDNPNGFDNRIGIEPGSNWLIENCSFEGESVIGQYTFGIFSSLGTSDVIVSKCHFFTLGCPMYLSGDMTRWQIVDCPRIEGGTTQYALIHIRGTTHDDLVIAHNNLITDDTWNDTPRGIYFSNEPTSLNAEIAGNNIEVTTGVSLAGATILGGIIFDNPGLGDGSDVHIHDNTINVDLPTSSARTNVAGVFLDLGGTTVKRGIRIRGCHIRMSVDGWAIGIYVNLSTTAYLVPLEISDCTFEIYGSGTSSASRSNMILLNSCSGFTISKCNGYIEGETDFASGAYLSAISGSSSALWGTITDCVFSIKRTNGAATNPIEGIGLDGGTITVSQCKGDVSDDGSGSNVGIDLIGAINSRFNCCGNNFTTAYGWTTGIQTNSCQKAAFTGNVVAGTITLGASSVKAGNAEGI